MPVFLIGAAIVAILAIGFLRPITEVSPTNTASIAIGALFPFDQAQERFELQSIDNDWGPAAESRLIELISRRASMSFESTYSDLRVECRETACRAHIEYSNDPELNEKRANVVNWRVADIRTRVLNGKFSAY
jgi:hypothetical protein